MYKDKDKQREAVKQAVRRHRAKGITEGITQANDVIPSVIPELPSVFDEETIKNLPEPQSYNPMMVGYVPPKPKA